MSLIVAGERSGVGKTTVTLGLLSYLSRQNLQVQSFKVGPDYIDPMFHQYVTGKTCRNLDPVLTSEVYVQQCFERNTQNVDFALVEGVMGLFDGVRFLADGFPDFASTAHISRLLNLPVLLVLDCSRLSTSVAAIAHGFLSFDPTINFAGLILNRVGSDRHLKLLQDGLKSINLPVLGVLRRHQNITIPDRHLGLIPSDEIPDLDNLIHDLGDLATKCFDWEKLLPLLKIKSQESQDSKINFSSSIVNYFAQKKSNFLIAVARDKAFNFYYQDNLDILTELGAKIVFWSPLKDENLPIGVEGLYFGGGFPEVFAQQLSENISAIKAVKAAIISGIPTYAECGGLMYLSEAIIDFNNNYWAMAGILPTKSIMGKSLKLGYRQVITNIDTAFLAANTQIYGHEFHRSELTETPAIPLYKMWRIDEKKKQETATIAGWNFYQVHASYLHLHWGSRIDIPQRFINYIEGKRRKGYGCGEEL